METKVNFTQGHPEFNKLMAWLVALFVALMVLHFVSCTPYPAQSKVLKQDTHRTNHKVGR